MNDEEVTFDVDGLIKDLDYLEDLYAKYYQENNGSLYLRGYINSIQVLRNCVYKNRHVKRWKQGTLFEEWKREKSREPIVRTGQCRSEARKNDRGHIFKRRVNDNGFCHWWFPLGRIAGEQEELL